MEKTANLDRAINKVRQELWVSHIKLKGLGDLFRMAAGESIIEEEGFHGISYLLAEIADEIEGSREHLERMNEQM